MMMMATAASHTFSVTSLATAIGVAQPQVSEWKRLGMPFDAKGRIALATAWRWIREHERRERPRIGRSESDERRAAAEAELAEMKVARERASLCPAAEVRVAAEDEALRVRGILVQIHTDHGAWLAATLGVPVRAATAALREIGERTARRLASADDADSEEAA